MLSVVIGCSISSVHSMSVQEPYLVVEQGSCAFDIPQYVYNGFAVDSTHIEVVA